MDNNRNLAVVVVLLAICTITQAQKLPNKQLQSIRVPKSFKADGKLDEWGQLQAYNSSTRLNYTVANNKDNLIFVLQAIYPAEIKKILLGNITIAINNQDDKDKKSDISLTFPNIRGADAASIGIKLTQNLIAADSAGRAKETDSLVRLMNSDMQQKIKDIKIKGFRQLTDTELSVYNEEGVKVTEAFDHNRALNFEIAIPLKYLGLSEYSKFGYKLTLNGMTQSTEIKVVNYADGTKVFGTPHGLGPVKGDGIDFFYPTYFEGEYSLI